MTWMQALIEIGFIAAPALIIALLLARTSKPKRQR